MHCKSKNYAIFMQAHIDQKLHLAYSRQVLQWQVTGVAGQSVRLKTVRGDSFATCGMCPPR